MKWNKLSATVAALALSLSFALAARADGVPRDDYRRDEKWRPAPQVKAQSTDSGIEVSASLTQSHAGQSQGQRQNSASTATSPPAPSRMPALQPVPAPPQSPFKATSGNTGQSTTQGSPKLTEATIASILQGADGRVYTRDELLTTVRAVPVGPLARAVTDGTDPMVRSGTLVEEADGFFWDLLGPARETAPAGIPPAPAAAAVSGGSSTEGTLGARAFEPREMAVEVLHHVPFPEIRPRMNPSLGLVALPSWFWVDGYDGQPFGASHRLDVPPLFDPEVPTTLVPADDPRRQSRSFTIQVRVRATSFEWSFGDGGRLTTQSLGHAYPQPSDIQHTYQYSSRGFPEGFPVRLTARFAAEYQVDDGAPQALATAERVYLATHRVQEIQAVLTGR